MKPIKSLGLCLGASNIKVVELIKEGDSIKVNKTIIRGHESNPRKVFKELLTELDINSYGYVGLTGRKFRNIINAESITEPEAIEYALQFDNISNKNKSHKAVASLGAENFIVYMLNKEGYISTVETGNKCASGTGEFFLQQIRRMNIGVDEAVNLGEDSTPYRVSGRCSVFCKSDCTHALNKGLPIGRVTAGLCNMMAEKVLDLLEKVNKKDIMVIGGVTKNRIVMNILRKKMDTLYIPEQADVFEALGAAYCALQKETKLGFDANTIFKKEKVSFDFLPPISKGKDLVSFKEIEKRPAEKGDTCIIGLDVGSTTTKAVMLRKKDNAILASIYLRTNGNPVKASRECYEELNKQIKTEINIIGLGVTGSGRQISGLHAETDSIINEIIAHATGASYFDKDVDTIFEIGGQDAKYTFLTNSVPSDYAMNEACSAGTGSFLEESAKESLGLDYKEIEKIAVKGDSPPNFNDQCAAFISSDIKTATHEGIEKENIVAGLVYSICMNYVNRVKGQRPVGKKIFMQGGVCYNKAVPLAMANLIEKEIIVPPEPGLIGSFGVALEVKHRLDIGLLNEKKFNLKELADRDISYGKSFVCSGGDENCDRACEVNMMIINGKTYPFGGACNKYYNLVHHLKYDATKFDFVKQRQDLVFRQELDPKKETKKIGLNKSLLTNMFYPLYYNFFTKLGLEVVLSDKVDPEGIKRKRTSICYPGEIAHGAFYNLLKKETDFIFLPLIRELFVDNSVSYKAEHQCTCVLLQSEPYYLKSAFKGLISKKTKILSPLITFSKGLDSQESVFIEIASDLGISKEKALESYHYAIKKQKEFSDKIKEKGREILKELENDKSKIAVVLFGRPYNAFAKEGNMGIPSKFASRGITVIPWDFLPFEDEPCDEYMNWAIGQNLMKAASFVKKHSQLFGAYITNFSCGPDSFLLGYFRDIMKTKPSLTLELDSHTADAGINTRIEAFLDIIKKYIEIGKKDPEEDKNYNQAKIIFEKNKPFFISSDNKKYSIYDKRVKVIFPSMGRLTSEGLSAAFRGAGINSRALPVYDFEVLKLGRGNTSCKECLPLQLTTGGLLKHIKHRKDKDELLVYFMPTTAGNCRFTQYSVFLNSLIKKNKLRNVALLSLSAENSYGGMGVRDSIHLLKSIVVSDTMEDIKNALEVLAVDKKEATAVFEAEWAKLIGSIESGCKRLYSLLEDAALNLSNIKLKYPLHDAKVVALAGEIFVRKDYFSCQDLIERLAKREIIVKRASLLEWLNYVDHIVKTGIHEPDFDLLGHVEFRAKLVLQKIYEKKIKKILSKSGLFEYELIDLENTLKYGKNLFDERFTGESILVAGAFFKDILHNVHGFISIGPFACMPTRVIESVLSAEANMETKISFEKDKEYFIKNFPDIGSLPFISIESDGNPFPQILEARIEAFCMQVERLHEKLKSIEDKSHNV